MSDQWGATTTTLLRAISNHTSFYRQAVVTNFLFTFWRNENGRNVCGEGKCGIPVPSFFCLACGWLSCDSDIRWISMKMFASKSYRWLGDCKGCTGESKENRIVNSDLPHTKIGYLEILGLKTLKAQSIKMTLILWLL